MNLIIVANKKDVKSYTQHITAPNITILGAVNYVGADLVSEIDKLKPHIVLIDTAVPTKLEIANVIEQLSNQLNYAKIIVLADSNDETSYKADYVSKGQITNIELNDILQKSKSINLSSDKVDKLSTYIPITYSKNKQNSINIRSILIIIAASILIVSLSIIGVVFKTSLNSGTATSDEVDNTVIETTVLVTEPTTINLPTENITVPITTIKNTTIVTEPSTATASTKPKTNTAMSVLPKSEEKSEKEQPEKKEEPKTESSKVQYKEPENNNSQNSNDNQSDYQSQNSVVISYGNDTYENVQNSNSISSIRLSYVQKTLAVGDTITLNATVEPSSAQYSLKWSSNNTSVVTISNNGMVTAVSTGTAKITCDAGSQAVTCNIIVI